MDDLQLRELLREAEPASPAAPVDAQAYSVLIARRFRHKRTVQRMSATMAAVLLVLTAAAVTQDWFPLGGENGNVAERSQQQRSISDTPKPPLTESQIAAIEREIAELHQQADAAHALARRLVIAELRVEAERLASELAVSPTYSELAARATDDAARTAVVQADALANKFGHRDEAQASYRAVLEKYPESQWAIVARERLEQTDSMMN